MALSFRRLVVRVAVGALAVAVPVALAPVAASAESPDLFISEYIEGSSYNKALEIYNGTGSAVDLVAGDYVVQLYSNGSATPSTRSPSPARSRPGTSGSSPTRMRAPWSSAGRTRPRRDDQLQRRRRGRAAQGWRAGPVLDSIGQVGFDPGTEWGTGLTSTMDNTLRRKAAVSRATPR